MSRRKNPEPTPQPTTRQDAWTQPSAKEQIEARRRERQDEQDNFDAYVNELTGIGDWTRDKTFGGLQGGLAFQVALIPSAAAEDRWRGSDLGGRVIETVPDEMTREGFELTVQPTEEDEPAGPPVEVEPEEEFEIDAFGEDPAEEGPPPKGPLPDVDDDGAEVAEEIDGALEELGADDAIWWALCYERAYGGGAILVGADDGVEDLSKPLDEENIKSVDWLNAFQGGYDGEIVAWSYYNDPRSKKYGLPETYMIRNLGVPIARLPAPGALGRDVLPRQQLRGYGQMIFWVHESRLLIFPGTPVSRNARVQMRGWGDSIFTRVDKVLADYNQTWGSIANLMTDFSQGVINVEGLNAKLSGNNKASKSYPITTRAKQIQITRSIARMLFLDADEKFTRETASLAGVSEILQQFALRLAAAADMPVTLLMGQAPAGLNATGASDVRFFYDRIAARQKKRMLPQLKRLLRILMLAKEGPTKGKEPERWSVAFRPLYQMTALEDAQLRKTVAEMDSIYIDKQVLSPEEVTASAFGGSAWTMERTIDLEGRAAMEAMAAASGVKPASGTAITPTAAASVMTVNEARAASGLGPLEPDGEMLLSEYMAKHAKAIGTAVQAEGGDPTPEDDPKEEKSASGGKPPFGGDKGSFGKGDEWNEADHPRAENGQFGEGGGETSGKKRAGEKKKLITSYPKGELKPTNEKSGDHPLHPGNGTARELSEYHEKAAAHWTARGEHGIAEGHKAIAQKYSKRAKKESH